jgi:hypothetical protein
MAMFDLVTDGESVCVAEQGGQQSKGVCMPIDRFKQLAGPVMQIGSRFADVRRTLDEREDGRMPDQRSTGEQLRDMARVADALGMYDAADAIRRMLAKGPADG